MLARAGSPSLIYRAASHLRRGSRIINIASGRGVPPQPNLAVYFRQPAGSPIHQRLPDAEPGARHPCDRGLPQVHADGVPRISGDAHRRPRNDAIGSELALTAWPPALRTCAAGNRCTFRRSKAYHASRVLPYKTALAAERALEVI